MPKDFLDTIFEFTGLDKESIEEARKTLFKYKDDPVINELCTIVQGHAKQANRLLEVFREANPKFWAKNDPKHAIPLVILNPDNIAELRVFPNILLNSYSSLESVNPSYCNDTFKDFIAEYEVDKADEKRKEKWNGKERINSRLLQTVNMPTARALTRYVFNKEDQDIKPDELRDFADAVDICRRPLEIRFAETAADFIHMYGSGVSSCMGHNAEGRDRWTHMINEGYCPTSWYAFCEYTKGAYVEKNGQVVARTILMKGKSDKSPWKWGRIFSSTTEYNNKFRNALSDLGIEQAERFQMPAQRVVIPGVKGEHGGYVAPIPYFDSPLPGSDRWKVSFDKDTKEFSFYYGMLEGDKLVNRGSYVLSTDYVAVNCSVCNRRINTRNEDVTPTEGDHVLCSDECAVNAGYVRVIAGNGNNVYKIPTKDMVDTTIPNIKLSTRKAVKDLGYAPFMEEIGIIPEDTDYKVVSYHNYASMVSGYERYCYRDEFGYTNRSKMQFSKIPVRLLPTVKRVEYEALVISGLE